MFKDLIENHFQIIKTAIKSDPKLLESLEYLTENLSRIDSIKIIKTDVEELGTASKAVYFMQARNRFKDMDFKTVLGEI